MKKKLMVFLLVALMLCQSMTGCADNKTDDETEASVVNTPTVPSSDEAETEEPEMSLAEARKLYDDRDYEGYEYRIADRFGQGSTEYWATFDVYATEVTGEVINDAVFERNIALEDDMNIKIVEMGLTSSVTATVKSSILASSDDYDTFTDGLSDLASLVSMNYLLDFKSINTVKCENEWWDQDIYTKLSIMNKAYFMTGDISVMDNYGTWCYLFNKTMVSDFGLDNPYELVDSGKWTVDKHNQMANIAMIDLNGDGKWSDDDYYGYVTEPYNVGAMWNCFGFRIVEKDEDDLPFFTYEGEEQLSAMMKSVDTQYGTFSNLGVTTNVGGAVSREDEFSNGHALFYYAGMRNITAFRDSDTDFGIIPAPKYNEEQPQYYSSYSAYNCTAYSVPITVSDPEKVGDIMEAMAHLSVYTLTPAYYDNTLIGKSTRDVESEPMIALILSTRNYDLGNIYNWGNIHSTITALKNSDVVASTLKRSKKAADKVLGKFLEEIVGR